MKHAGQKGNHGKPCRKNRIHLLLVHEYLPFNALKLNKFVGICDNKYMDPMGKNYTYTTVYIHIVFAYIYIHGISFLLL